MSEHVYKQIELTGTSSRSIEDAINTSLARAARTIRDLKWFQVIETRGEIAGTKSAIGR